HRRGVVLAGGVKNQGHHLGGHEVTAGPVHEHMHVSVPSRARSAEDLVERTAIARRIHPSYRPIRSRPTTIAPASQATRIRRPTMHSSALDRRVLRLTLALSIALALPSAT